MNLIHDIFSAIDWTMTTPSLYGWFHILSIILLVAVILMITKLVKRNPDKTVKNTILAFSIISVTLELVKQGLFTHVASQYQWYAFPFQFCSTPMYISVLSLLIKNPKIKGALYSFLAFYGLFGGLLVMAYPGDVFIDLITIDIQTMVHHGGMVVVGVTLILAQKVKLDFRSLLKATYVFLCLILVAQTLNVIAHYTVDGTFNMFFISPFYLTTLPILSAIQSSQPYPVFLLAYVFGFIFAAFVIQKLCQLIQKLHNSLSRSKKAAVASNTLAHES